MLDWVCDNRDRPEEGIWETRGGRQTEQRDAISEQIMAKGWHHERTTFVQHKDTGVLDASLLFPAGIQPPLPHHAAVNLDYQLDHGSAFVEPVLSKGRRTT